MAQISRGLAMQKIMGGWLTDNEVNQLCYHYIKTTDPNRTADEIDEDIFKRGEIVWSELLAGIE